MTEKDYNFNEFYGRLNTYRNSDQLFLTERVLQSPEVNRLISAQLAKEQINQCEALEELHDDLMEHPMKTGARGPVVSRCGLHSYSHTRWT